MINPMDMTGHRVMVTGASSGLGRATAIQLSQLGAELVLVARNQGRLEDTLSQLTGHGHHIIVRDLGVDTDIIPTWMKHVTQTTGALHGLVHSAGIVSLVPLRVLSEERVNDVLRINLTAGLMLIKGFRQRNVVAAPASVVFLGSITGLIGQPGLAAYSASKGALFAATRSLALELASEGIRVNALAPGIVKTEMAEQSANELPPESFASLEAGHPLGLGEPIDVANAASFLLSPAARWITGSTLVIDGGYTCQ